jgi:hypothetical protein
MLFRSLYFSSLILIRTSGASETQPPGSALIWEFVNCQDPNGLQSAELWAWSEGNNPTQTGTPDYKYKVNSGGPYYWEGRITTYPDFFTRQHQTYIYQQANTYNEGPQGIQVSSEDAGELLSAAHLHVAMVAPTH